MPSGKPASAVSGGADFNVTAEYGGRDQAGFPPSVSGSIIEVQDGHLLQTDPSAIAGDQFAWLAQQGAVPPGALELINTHQYLTGPSGGFPLFTPSGDVEDGMLVVSDFSALKINTSPNTDGIATFKVSVTNATGNFFSTLVETYEAMNDEDTLSCIRFMGARFLWIWE